MFDNAKNTKQQGTIGLGQAIAYFTSKCYVVSLPLNDSQAYDLIVDDGESLNKVQVKTTSNKTPHGIFQVLLKTCGGNQSYHTVKHFDSTVVDYLFVTTSEGVSYCIPCSTFDNKSGLNLGKLQEQYRITDGSGPAWTRTAV